MSAIDIEIRKYLQLLGAEQKRSLLDAIKALLHLQKQPDDKKQYERTSFDYSQFNFPPSAIKFNRDEINER